jgi:hypothetical protein
MSVHSFPETVILSTAYFPPIEYFRLMVHHSKVIIDVHETYSKQTWRNRCAILGGNGVLSLSIPVEKPFGNRTRTSEILISNHYKWKINHWRSIESAYNNAPYFLYYKDLVEGIVCKEDCNLLDQLNRLIINQLIMELSLNVDLSYADSFFQNPDTDKYLDMRFRLSPKYRANSSDPAFHFPPYYQVFEDRFGFQPNLSILDLIFNLGPDTKEYLEGTEA